MICGIVCTRTQKGEEKSKSFNTTNVIRAMEHSCSHKLQGMNLFLKHKKVKTSVILQVQAMKNGLSSLIRIIHSGHLHLT